MNKILLLATMFASVVLLGCSNTDIGTEPQKDGIIFDGGTETKTTMDGSYVFSWVKDADKIGIFAKNAAGAIYTPNAVEHKVTESKHISPFAAVGTGIDWSGMGTHTFYAYHPYVSASDYANVSIPLSSTQTQAAANDNSHVGLNAIMTASITADPAQGNNVSLQFAQQTSFFEFRVSADAANAATIKSITVKTNAPISGTGINYDFTTNDYTVVGGVNEATLTFTTPMPVTTTVQKGWLSFLPGTFTSLTFTITYSDGKIQDIVKPNPSYTFGKAKLIPVDLKAAPAVTPPGPSPLALCSIAALNNSWAYLSAFTVGDKSVTITKTADNAYIDKTAEAAANVTVGSNVSATVGGNQQNNIIAWVDWNADGNLDASEIVGKSKDAAASLTFKFPGKSGMPSGIYYMRIGTNYKDGKGGCDNANADESRTACDIAINYTSNEDPNAPAKGRIVAADGLKASVTATADVTKTFTVSLTKASKEASTFTLVATSNNNLSGTLSTSSVTIPAGETSVNASITFSKSVFITDAAATVTVTATNTNSPALDMINSNIVYDVKGPVSIQDRQLYCEFYFNDGLWTVLTPILDFKGATTPIGVQVYSSTYLGGDIDYDPAVTFDYTLSGTLT
ncbi:MAG: fimbrillin family protein, partial [Rikenellaceae bacterium]